MDTNWLFGVPIFQRFRFAPDGSMHAPPSVAGCGMVAIWFGLVWFGLVWDGVSGVTGMGPGIVRAIIASIAYEGGARPDVE